MVFVLLQVGGICFNLTLGFAKNMIFEKLCFYNTTTTIHPIKVSKLVSFVKHLGREPQIWSNILRRHSDWILYLVCKLFSQSDKSPPSWLVVLVPENMLKCHITIICSIMITVYYNCIVLKVTQNLFWHRYCGMSWVGSAVGSWYTTDTVSGAWASEW